MLQALRGVLKDGCGREVPPQISEQVTELVVRLTLDLGDVTKTVRLRALVSLLATPNLSHRAQ